MAYDRVPFSQYTLLPLEAKKFVKYGLDHDDDDYKSLILRDNAVPMLLAWHHYKDREFTRAIRKAERIHDEDWRYACIAWLERRQKGTPHVQE
jgi:hypothetical protein